MALMHQLVTVEEFQSLPEDSGEFYHELHYGKVVTMVRPKFGHSNIQSQLFAALLPWARSRGVVYNELCYRALPEYDLRVADVAFVAHDRVKATKPEDFLRGAPDLVIKVLSPSNTVSEIKDKEKLCLENGAREFWVVDSKLKQVKVSMPDGHTITYQSGSEIPLAMFDNAKLPVDTIFDLGM